MEKSNDVLNIGIKRGSHWVHRNGHRYVVLYIANTYGKDATYPISVVYHSAMDESRVLGQGIKQFLANYVPRRRLK